MIRALLAASLLIVAGMVQDQTVRDAPTFVHEVTFPAESIAMRQFFERENQQTMDTLSAYFARGAAR